MQDNADRTPNPIKGAPAYFKRIYTGGNVQSIDTTTMTVVSDTGPLIHDLAIYGIGAMSDYEEDHDHEYMVWNNRQAFFGWCFSVMEPDGEPGMTPLAAVTPITKEEFETARSRGWA